MVDIKSVELSIFIETNEFNWPLQDVVNEVQFTNQEMDMDEVYLNTSNIVSALVMEDLIVLVCTTFEQESEDVYRPLAEKSFSKDDALEFLKEYTLWDEKDAFSFTKTVQLKITDKGRNHYRENY